MSLQLRVHLLKGLRLLMLPLMAFSDRSDTLGLKLLILLYPCITHSFPCQVIALLEAMGG